MTRLGAFARFWYDFIVGDDWRVAVGVGAGIALTAALVSAGLSAWWLMPSRWSRRCSRRCGEPHARG